MISIVWRQKLASQPLAIVSQILFESRQTHFQDINIDFSSNHNYISDMINRTRGNDEVHMKEIQHMGLILGNISSTSTKIMELILTFKLNALTIKGVSCLTEGSGGILYLMGCIYPKSNHNYSTLINPDIDMRIIPDMNYPPTFHNTRLNHKDRCIGLDITAIGITDILQQMFITKYKHFLETYTLRCVNYAEALTTERGMV